MKPTTLSLSFLTLAASVFAASAQTAPKPAAAAHAPVAHKAVAAAPARSEAAACVTIPAVSDKIPALPAAASCIKPLFTVSAKPSIVLDYASPLMLPETLESIVPKPMIITLLYTDIKVGEGELAKPGKFYTVSYTGYLPDGTKFDASADHGGTFTFPRGAHQVIAGWDLGFDGMHIGGKRRLYIPFQLAYGEQGKPPTIPAKAELIFDMELISQSDTKPEPKPEPAPAAATPAPAAATPAPAAKETAKPETK